MSKILYTATCLFGLEHLLGEEIDNLGYDRVETMDGRITFLGDEETVALANVFLRYAERVYIHLGTCGASSFDELFEGVKAMPWERWIGRTDAFPVKGHSIKSVLTSLPALQSIIKKAVVTRLGEIYSIRTFEESGVKYQIEFFLFKDKASLMIDTSGAPLHKRGYRRESNLAPIRETLAAAIAATSRPRENVLLWDPMCGSGTIAIEAALLANKIAPGMYRRFAAEQFAAFPREVWKNAREEARDTRLDTAIEIYASDIDEGAVELTSHNARVAGVDKWVRSFVSDATKISALGRRGTIVTNPPYGERLSTPKEVEELYRRIGVHFRSLAPWQVYVITSHPDFQKFYGARADKVRKLYNGMIPCFLYQYFKNDKK